MNYPEPNAKHCSNPHRDDYWTSPCCYADMYDVGSGTHPCPECGRPIVCTVEMEPACHARLEEVDLDDI